MTLYLAVTADKYELPVFVATSRSEMAEWQGVSPDAISQAICRYERSQNRRKQLHPTYPVRFCRVVVEDDDE